MFNLFPFDMSSKVSFVAKNPVSRPCLGGGGGGAYVSECGTLVCPIFMKLGKNMCFDDIWAQFNKKPSETGDAPQSVFLSQYCTIYSEDKRTIYL